MPELGFQTRLADALPGVNRGFALNIQSSLDDIYNSRNVSHPPGMAHR
jgi:hypothetical protein